MTESNWQKKEDKNRGFFYCFMHKYARQVHLLNKKNILGIFFDFEWLRLLKLILPFYVDIFSEKLSKMNKKFQG